MVKLFLKFTDWGTAVKMPRGDEAYSTPSVIHKKPKRGRQAVSFPRKSSASKRRVLPSQRFPISSCRVLGHARGDGRRGRSTRKERSHVPSTVATSSTAHETRVVSTTRAHTSSPGDRTKGKRKGFVREEKGTLPAAISRRPYAFFFVSFRSLGQDDLRDATYLSTPPGTRYRTRLRPAVGSIRLSRRLGRKIPGRVVSS